MTSARDWWREGVTQDFHYSEWVIEDAESAVRA